VAHSIRHLPYSASTYPIRPLPWIDSIGVRTMLHSWGSLAQVSLGFIGLRRGCTYSVNIRPPFGERGVPIFGQSCIRTPSRGGVLLFGQSCIRTPSGGGVLLFGQSCIRTPSGGRVLLFGQSCVRTPMMKEGCAYSAMYVFDHFENVFGHPSEGGASILPYPILPL
jgi:hypothetical protein